MGRDANGDPEVPDLCRACRAAYTATRVRVRRYPIRGTAPELATWVRDLRWRLGDEHRPLSQRKLAARIGCSENAVIGWECWGRHPYPVVARVLRELGASVGLAPWTD